MKADQASMRGNFELQQLIAAIYIFVARNYSKKKLRTINDAFNSKHLYVQHKIIYFKNNFPQNY